MNTGEIIVMAMMFSIWSGGMFLVGALWEQERHK